MASCVQKASVIYDAIVQDFWRLKTDYAASRLKAVNAAELRELANILFMTKMATQCKSHT